MGSTGFSLISGENDVLSPTAQAGTVTSLHTNHEVCIADMAEGAVIPDRKFLNQLTLPWDP